MSDLTPERLAEWREDSLSAIRDGFGLEPEDVGDIADTRILALIDALESARAERDRFDDEAERLGVRAAEVEAERLREATRPTARRWSAVRAEAEVVRLRAKLARVEEALARHPEVKVCDRHSEDGPITCGWKRAVADVTAALADEGGDDAT